MRFFQKAGATGHVFRTRFGRRTALGLAWSGLVLPFDTLAVVPTTTQTVELNLQLQTADRQEIVVAGSVLIRLVADAAVATFDFTVDVRSGAYLEHWRDSVRIVVLEQIQKSVRRHAAAVAVSAAVADPAGFEAAIQAALEHAQSVLGGRGVQFEACMLTQVTPGDRKLAEALGAGERQALLAAADAAIHERQIKSAEHSRVLQSFEAATTLRLEEERGRLVARRGENAIAEATAEATAARRRLEAFAGLTPPQLMAAALLRAAEGGRLGNVTLTSDVIAALRGTGEPAP
jgi:hypothetical protein